MKPQTLFNLTLGSYAASSVFDDWKYAVPRLLVGFVFFLAMAGVDKVFIEKEQK